MAPRHLGTLYSYIIWLYISSPAWPALRELLTNAQSMTLEIDVSTELTHASIAHAYRSTHIPTQTQHELIHTFIFIYSHTYIIIHAKTQTRSHSLDAHLHNGCHGYYATDKASNIMYTIRKRAHTNTSCF